MNTFLGGVGMFLLVIGAQTGAVTPLGAVMIILGGSAIAIGLIRETP